MEVALYSRVSTSEQDPESALPDLRDAARRRGWTIALEIVETGSGRRADRPGWGQILKAARGLDFVAVWTLDRAGRSMLDLLSQIDHLRRAGCGLWAVSQNLEISAQNVDAASQLTLNVLAAVAEFERRIIVQRTRDGIARARARGVQLGRPTVDLPDVDLVRALRSERPPVSWRQIAERLGCTVWAARRAGSM